MGLTKVALVFVALAVFVTVSVSRSPGHFLGIDCDTVYNCTGLKKPVCCTDANTYSSNCSVLLENQKRFCSIGNFNYLAYVHEGNCTDKDRQIATGHS